MRKVMLLAVLLLVGGIITNASDLLDEYREKMDIRETVTKRNKTKKDRSVSIYVAAYYLPEQSKIELYHDGIGDAEVYILDAMNQSLSQESVYADDFVDYISVTDTPGIYYIIISSDTYYGEATFTVQ